MSYYLAQFFFTEEKKRQAEGNGRAGDGGFLTFLLQYRSARALKLRERILPARVNSVNERESIETAGTALLHTLSLLSPEANRGREGERGAKIEYYWRPGWRPGGGSDPETWRNFDNGRDLKLDENSGPLHPGNPEKMAIF